MDFIQDFQEGFLFFMVIKNNLLFYLFFLKFYVIDGYFIKMFEDVIFGIWDIMLLQL